MLRPRGASAAQPLLGIKGCKDLCAPPHLGKAESLSCSSGDTGKTQIQDFIPSYPQQIFED